MLARLLLILPILLSGASGQVPTYSVAGPNDSPSIAALEHRLDGREAAAVERFWEAIHKNGAPLIEPAAGANGFSLVTFLWQGNDQTRNVVIFDGVAGFDAKGRMLHLDGTDVWYKSYRVRNDARFAYKESEWLTKLVHATPKLPLRFYLEVGLMESYSMQIETNRRMRDALAAKGYPVGYSEYDGGHSFLNWSGGLANGLEYLIRSSDPKNAVSHD
jgi:hypothetical protein